jgi:hypothetical protein
MKSRRLLAAAGVLVLSAWLGQEVGSSVIGAGSRMPTVRGQAMPGGDTYVLSDFRVRYPFTPAPEGSREDYGPPDSNKAAVFFTANWSGDRFPGEVWCEVVVLGEGGDVVGMARFLGAYAAPIRRSPPVPVDVLGEPVSATGSCEAGTYPPGPGYMFGDPRITPNDSEEIQGRSEIAFTVRWATPGRDPSVRICHLSLMLEDGRTIDLGSFGFDAPDGVEATFGAPASPDRIEDAVVTCSELQGDAG